MTSPVEETNDDLARLQQLAGFFAIVRMLNKDVFSPLFPGSLLHATSG